MNKAYPLLFSLPSNKEQVEKFSDMLRLELSEGEIDPLKLRVIQRCMESVFDNIKEELDDLCLSEAERYGEKSFEFKGAVIQIGEVRPKYDFSKCNYPPLLRLRNHEAELKAQIKKEEEFLKSIRGTKTVIDELTGEVVEARPPIKLSKTGIKISLK